MPSYVARPHVLTDEFVPGYLGDSFGFFPFVHGDPLANQFDGPFLVRLIRKEVTRISGFPFGIESRDPDIPSCWHSGTMRCSCCWSIPCHNQANPLPTNDTPASDIPQRFQCPAMLGDGGVRGGRVKIVPPVGVHVLVTVLLEQLAGHDGALPWEEAMARQLT